MPCFHLLFVHKVPKVVEGGCPLTKQAAWGSPRTRPLSGASSTAAFGRVSRERVFAQECRCVGLWMCGFCFEALTVAL